MSGRETSGSRGGVEPARKRRKFLDAGGPIEDDETARQKMRDAKVGVTAPKASMSDLIPSMSKMLKELRLPRRRRLCLLCL